MNGKLTAEATTLFAAVIGFAFGKAGDKDA
jgi:hypothetical protein